jgi:hypothetical protein
MLFIIYCVVYHLLCCLSSVVLSIICCVSPIIRHLDSVIQSNLSCPSPSRVSRLLSELRKLESIGYGNSLSKLKLPKIPQHILVNHGQGQMARLLSLLS